MLDDDPHSEDENKMNEISGSSDNMSWEQCLEKLYYDDRFDAAGPEYPNMLFLETRAGWKYITDLSKAENALVLGHGTEIISLNLCRSFNNVYAMDRSLERLKLTKKMSEARGFKNLTTVQGNDSKNFPFPSGFFDLICAPGELERVPLKYKDNRTDLNCKFLKESDGTIEPRLDSNPMMIQMNYLSEIHRILKPNGNLYLATGNRFNYHFFLKAPDKHPKPLYALLIPGFIAATYSLIARGGSYRSYMHSYFSLKKVLQNCGFKQIDFYSLRPDHRLFYEIIFFNKRKALHVREGNIKEKIKEELYRSKYLSPSFGIVARKDESRFTFLQNVLKLLINEHEVNYEVNRYYVMKKGNVVLDLVDMRDKKRGLIVKIPIDDISESQNMKNYAVLSNMHKNPLIPQDIKALIPGPTGQYTINGQKIYTEEKFNGLQAGRAVQDEQVKNSVVRSAFDFIVALHKATLRKVTWSEDDYSKMIGTLIERVRRIGKKGQGAFSKIDSMLRSKFVGREILVAQKHGDFSFANILIDPQNHGIQGIIDWDNSEYGHPLLIDLINLIESSYNCKDLELGYTIAHILLRDKLTGEEKVILKRYLFTFGYAEDLILPYTILYWLYHFDSQIKYNYLIHNPKWMTENYYNVITVIDKIL
jgi:SAM-dependent methyltransferase